MSDEQAPDTKELERSLCSLPDVEAVRVVVDDKGRPAEIHVVVTALKEPKRVSRDIHTFALASLGIDLDRRIISVVQNSAERLEQQQPSAAAAIAERPTIGAIETRTAGARTTVQVVLTRGGAEAAGTAEGTASSETRARLLATASVDALRKLESAGEAFDVATTQIVRAGSEEVAVVTLVCLDPPTEQLLAGAAIVTADYDQAIVRAVLDATNRRLPYLAQCRSVHAP